MDVVGAASVAWIFSGWRYRAKPSAAYLVVRGKAALCAILKAKMGGLRLRLAYTCEGSGSR